MKLCSNVESKKFTCKECPYVVDRQDRLKTHQEKKHSKSVSNKFQCTFCQKEFSTKSYLKDQNAVELKFQLEPLMHFES